MKSLHVIFYTCLLSLIAVIPDVKAQVDSTVVRFYIPSQYFIIKVGNKFFENRKIVKLPQGVQRIQIYTPEFNLVDTLIVIEDLPDGQMIMPSFSVNMDFDRYQIEMKNYRDKNFIELGVPLITSAFAFGYAVYYYNQANASYENAAWYYRKWLGANNTERPVYLDEFQRHNADYKQFRRMNYITLALAGVSSVFTIRGYIRYRKRQMPVYKIPPVPFDEYYIRLQPLTYDLLYPGIQIIVPF